MQLLSARLCLDCEEVHDRQRCPVCASDSFTPISRWVPAEVKSRRPRPTTSPEVEAYRAITGVDPKASGRRLLKQGMLGLTAVGLIGWFMRSNGPGRAAAAAPAGGADERSKGSEN
jgi:hypothetical protein